MRLLPDDNLLYPVLISTAAGAPLGSGFWVNTPDALHLITAKHVLYANGTLTVPVIHATSYQADFVTKVKFAVDFGALPPGYLKPHQTADVVAVKIGTMAQAAPAGGRVITFPPGLTALTQGQNRIVGLSDTMMRLYADAMVSNDVFIFGFPTSLGIPGQPQLEQDRPLLRKGIIAGKNNSLQTIIIDCPVYQGNSGGLAVEYEQVDLHNFSFKPIGVVVSFVPFVEAFRSSQFGYINTTIENSGYAIVEPMDRVKELL